MPTDSGYNNQKKKGTAQFETVHGLGSDRYGKAVTNKGLYEKTAAAAIVSVTPIYGPDGQIQYYNIEFTAHGASAGDVIRMATGTLIGFEFEIASVINANNFYVLPISPSSPIAAETASIMAWVTQKLTSDGDINVSITTPPTQFNYDGVAQTVEQDTAVPANNRGMPSLQFIYIDGVQYPVGKDTGTPANTVSVPVEITGASGPINITAGDINVQLTDLGADFDRTRIGDGTNQLSINADGSINITSAQLPATLGEKAEAASTSITLSTENLSLLNDIETNTNTILTKFPASIGQKLTNDSISVTLSSDHGNVPVTGPLTDAQLRAVAVPVSGTFWQATQPVSAASLPLPTGAATEAKQDAEAILIGDVVEAAPASDTASSGLNGRLQRIAQRITSLIALIPTSLGQKTMANSFAVTLASDQSALSITQTAQTASYQEDITVGTVETFTAPAGAKSCVIQALSSNTVNLRVKIGGGVATTTSGYVFEPGRSEVFPFAGDISYVSESTTGQAINVHFGV